MKRKFIVITFTILSTFLAIKFYMDCVVNPILAAAYGGKISTPDIVELILLIIFLLLLPIIYMVSGLRITSAKKIILIWSLTTIAYFFIPVINFIQGYNEIIRIQQRKTDLPVILKCNGSFTRIYSVGFPIGLEVRNKAITRRKIDVVDYFYNTGEKASGESRGWDDFNDLYIEGKDSLIRIPFAWEANQYKTLKGLQTVNMVVYTTHKPEISDDVQRLLLPYLYTMMENDLTTLEVGTIQQLKEDNPQLLDAFLSGNEITVINWGERKKYLSNILKVEY